MSIRKALGTLGFVVQVAAIVFITKSFAFAQVYIPSESMVPTLEVGDRLITDKTAYGWSRHSLLVDPHVSFPGKEGRLFGRLPKRGDVVTFTHPRTGETLIKRVIGLPGDRIAMKNGRLIINGKTVERDFKGDYSYRQYRGGTVSVRRYDEHLPGGEVHEIIEQTDHGYADNMAEVTVPPGHIFFMGDNRDNSADSRFAELGFVPEENIQGQARLITYSLHDCRPEPGLACAPRRFLSPID